MQFSQLDFTMFNNELLLNLEVEQCIKQRIIYLKRKIYKKKIMFSLTAVMGF